MEKEEKYKPAKRVKKTYRKSNTSLSLKQWCRQEEQKDNEDVSKWLENKKRAG